MWWFVAGESKVQVGMIVPSRFARSRGADDHEQGGAAGGSAARRPPSILEGCPAATSSPPSIFRRPGSAGRPSISATAGSRSRRSAGAENLPNVVEVVLEKLERRAVPSSPGSAVRRRSDGGSRRSNRPVRVDGEALPDEHSRIRSLSTDEIVPEASSGVFSKRARVDLREGMLESSGIRCPGDDPFR